MKSLSKLTAGIMAVIMLIALAAYDTKEAGAIVYAAENQYVCSWCKGTVVCKECGGSGKNNATSIVLQSLGCTLGDKTGKCAKCGGDGWASY